MSDKSEDDRNYGFGTTYNAIEEDLLTLPPVMGDICACDCHSLWGLNAAHIIACCSKMIEDND